MHSRCFLALETEWQHQANCLKRRSRFKVQKILTLDEAVYAELTHPAEVRLNLEGVNSINEEVEESLH